MENNKKIEINLGEGTMVTLSMTQRVPEIEERFGIVPGRIYRVAIAGINPLDEITFDGKLEEVKLHLCQKGFVLSSVELKDGLNYSIGSKRMPFEREVLLLENERVTAFGRIMNEEGFKRVRESIIYEHIS